MHSIRLSRSRRFLTVAAGAALLLALFAPSAQAVTRPASPTSFSAWKVDSTHVGYRFRDNSTNEHGFRVERRTSSSVTYFWLPAHSGTGTYGNFSNTVSRGTRYCYRASAYVTEAGVKIYSSSQTNEVCVQM